MTTDPFRTRSQTAAFSRFSRTIGGRWRKDARCVRSVSAGQYAGAHNPAPYYTSLGPSCTTQDLPLNPTPDVTARFSLITPNLCDDMHDCSTVVGDRWLAVELPMILSPTYHAGHTVVFITWDEDDTGDGTVPTYVIAPSVHAGTQSAVPFTHYSLLRTTEELLGLLPLLGPPPPPTRWLQRSTFEHQCRLPAAWDELPLGFAHCDRTPLLPVMGPP